MASNNTQNSKSSRIDMDDSPNMNEDEMAMFLNVRRSRSDESMIGKLFNQPIEAEKSRPLIISIPPPTPDNNATNSMSSFKLFRKIKKEKKKNESDYCKNICGYITKKIIRELCSPNYANHVKGLCSKYKCEYQEVKTFYLPKIQQVTGPSHIPSLLVADGQQDQKIKEVFKEFFQWFIKSRYLRYLLIEGKMADKKAYIKYKNYMLLAMLNQNKSQNGSNYIIKSEED